jgi:HEAT repeat protein
MMMTRAWSYSVALALISGALVGSAQDSRSAPELVRQLAQFEAALDARIQSDTGLPMPAEQQRADIYAKLRALADQAVPALQRGLTDADVQIRRNVVLYLGVAGADYVKPAPLNLKPFLAQLVAALRDSDERVKALAAQALANVGADAVIAIPDLIRLLEDPIEGLRNTACIGLAGIGPAAREALPALQRALSDPSNDVRQFAQRAIERIAPK